MLVDLLTNGKASHPAISVVDGPSINYGELARQVDDLSKTLGTLGLGKSDRIAMALPNGLEVIALFLAASAAGTAAPLNPAYTRDEFRFYLEDTNARALIVPRNGLRRREPQRRKTLSSLKLISTKPATSAYCQTEPPRVAKLET